MTTDKFDFKEDDQQSEWVNKKSTIDDFLKNSSEQKYFSKPKRMIRQVLEDGTVIIGKNRYDALKKIPKNQLIRNQEQEIKDFENYHGITESKEKVLDAWEKLKIKEEERKKKEKEIIASINKKTVWKAFKRIYKKHYKVTFEENDETLQNIAPIIKYFSKDPDFLRYGVKDKDGNFLSKPSFDKGLCIIGGFGNGKTSVMNTMQRMFIGLEGYAFGRFSSHEIITKYEQLSKLKNPEHIENYWSTLTKGPLYIDDVKAEPLALVFGKTNVLNNLFQVRYNKGLKTHISINYAPGHKDKPLEALLEFKTKYSEQVYDRIYEMYNIIEFKGKSYRR